MDELVGKLPMSRRVEWARESIRVGARSIKCFAQWLTNEARIVNLVTNQQQPPRTAKSVAQNNINRKHVLISHNESPKKLICEFCAEAHTITECKKFRSLSNKDRWAEVSKRPLCFCCLSPKHLLPACDKKEKCGAVDCEKWHNALLQDNEKKPSSKIRRRGGPTRRPTPRSPGHRESTGSNRPSIN